MELKDYYLIQDLDLAEKTVLLRVDLNLPIIDQKIQDYTRLHAIKPTIDYLIEKKCKIVLLSHFGRVKTIKDLTTKTLQPVAKALAEEYPLFFTKFLPVNTGLVVKETIEQMFSKQIILLENTRHHDINIDGKIQSFESKNNLKLAQEWAQLADVFINDAFGLIHRAHASNVGISSLVKKKAIGFLIQKEILALTKITNNPKKPMIGILGGSKISDKLKLIKNILPKVDYLLIGGAMVYTFMLAKELSVGNSMVEESMIEECQEILKNYSKKIILPLDHVVNAEMIDQPGVIIRDNDTEAWKNKMGFDIGPKTIKYFKSFLKNAETIFWNGPMGVFEMQNYSIGTKSLIEFIISLTKDKKIFTLIGGGDTASIVTQLGAASKVSFVSTGGGATLSFLEATSLPGLEIMKK